MVPQIYFCLLITSYGLNRKTISSERKWANKLKNKKNLEEHNMLKKFKLCSIREHVTAAESLKVVISMQVLP